MVRAVSVVALLLAVVLGGGADAPAPLTRPDPPPETAGITVTAGAPGAAVVPRPATRSTRPLPGIAGVPAPVAIDLPSLGSRARIVPVDVRPNGQLTVPDDPKVVGWWRTGDPALVLDGHIDSAVLGIGALFRLAALAPGDALTLTTADGARHPFVVTSMRAFNKKVLPPEVFTTPGELVVISCGGRFDRAIRQYTDNIVVRARPA